MFTVPNWNLFSFYKELHFFSAIDASSSWSHAVSAGTGLDGLDARIADYFDVVTEHTQPLDNNDHIC
jgi:hypothetical protein